MRYCTYTCFRQSNMYKRNDTYITVHTKFQLHSPTQGVKTTCTITTEEAAASVCFFLSHCTPFVLSKSRPMNQIIPSRKDHFRKQPSLFCWLECVCTLCPCSVYNIFPSVRSRIFIVESLDAVIRKLPAGWKDKLFTTPQWTGKHKHTQTRYEKNGFLLTQVCPKIKEYIVCLLLSCIYIFTSCA